MVRFKSESWKWLTHMEWRKKLSGLAEALRGLVIKQMIPEGMRVTWMKEEILKEKKIFRPMSLWEPTV